MDPGGPVRRKTGNLSKLKESLVLMAGSNKLTTAPVVSLLSNPDCIQVILMITAGSLTIIVFEKSV